MDEQNILALLEQAINLGINDLELLRGTPTGNELQKMLTSLQQALVHLSAATDQLPATMAMVNQARAGRGLPPL